MDNNFKKYFLLILAAIFLVAATIIENQLLNSHPEKVLLNKFQSQLWEKERRLTVQIQEIKKNLEAANEESDFTYLLQPFNNSMAKEGMGFMVFEEENLVYWSDQEISFDTNPDSIKTGTEVVHLPNGYYLSEAIRFGDLLINGLALIRYEYPHENNYLKNGFQKDFRLPDNYRILSQEVKNSVQIYSTRGEYLFSILPAGEVLCTVAQLYFPAALYIFAFILLLAFARNEFNRSDQPHLAKLGILILSLGIFYWLHILFKFPKVFYILDFFSPSYFGYSYMLPSLGDYFLISVFFLFLTLNSTKKTEPGNLLPTGFIRARFSLFLSLTALALVYNAVNVFISILIENSIFSFPLNHITDLSTQSVIGYCSIGFLMLGLAILTIQTNKYFRDRCSGKEIVVFTFTAVLMMLIVQILSGDISVPVILFFASINFILLIFDKDGLSQFTLSYLIILVSVFSIYSLFVIYTNVSAKERSELRHFAFNLETEHDPAAELQLTGIQNKINHDPIIPNLLIPPYDSLPQLDNYIINKYFSGYFRNYNIQVTTCTGTDSLIVQPDNITVPCFPFFDERIERNGLLVEGTKFYFMDEMNGSITYLGKIHYPLAIDTVGISIYIELKSSVVAEGIGYPELLMDRSMIKSYNRFNYAKYIDGKLVDQHGDFTYNQNLFSYDFTDDETDYLKWNGHEHIINHIREGNYVVVSRKTYGFFEYLISFPYLFVFYFILTILFLIIWNNLLRNRNHVFDLKFKIQAAIITIVMLSLLIIAVGTVFYNIDAYKAKHREDLNEKMKSIAEEIEMRKDMIMDLTPENNSWLYNELIKLSNIFRTDVNVYGIDGDLIASSRPEIYEKGLISKRMNANAYFELDSRFRIDFSQPEKIGKLSYLSAYRPIFNDSGTQFIGFINLPYFTRQDSYRQEITTFIVAFINLYVIFFLASILVAVFIANQITRPLTVIRDNLRKMQLGKRSEPINYTRNDEIGSLVKEYNKKVDELAASAELLARSERESAWREMAKQIAHEIKNPLTPMKLNIQYLQRLKNDPKELDSNLEKVTRMLIEQIDGLSSIATEFSNFAQIPTARNQVFNVAEQLKKVIDLFETHEKSNIRINFDGSEAIFVNADREQFSRAIINLVKNAIQAIPAKQEGIVGIYMSRVNDFVQIKVEDNGIGIADELQEKMFSPSFTTKSSGMGLGLAIVKNIVENFRGHIWYETIPGRGTTFFIEIPVYETTQH